MGNGKLKPHPTFPFYVFPPTPTPENNKAIKDNKDTKGEIVKRTTPKNKISIGHLSFADDFIRPLLSTVTVDYYSAGFPRARPSVRSLPIFRHYN